MLLFVKKRFVDQIVAGVKTYEIRHGLKYRNIRPGDSLSINGRFRLNVTHVEEHDRASLLRARLINPADLDDCYASADGPFYVMYFKPPAAVPPARAK